MTRTMTTNETIVGMNGTPAGSRNSTYTRLRISGYIMAHMTEPRERYFDAATMQTNMKTRMKNATGSVHKISAPCLPRLFRP